MNVHTASQLLGDLLGSATVKARLQLSSVHCRRSDMQLVVEAARAQQPARAEQQQRYDRADRVAHARLQKGKRAKEQGARFRAMQQHARACSTDAVHESSRQHAVTTAEGSRAATAISLPTSLSIPSNRGHSYHKAQIVPRWRGDDAVAEDERRRAEVHQTNPRRLGLR